jgi:hypothetical protein
VLSWVINLSIAEWIIRRPKSIVNPVSTSQLGITGDA